MRGFYLTSELVFHIVGRDIFTQGGSILKSEPIYKRIILKLTGEIFRDDESNLSETRAEIAAQEIKEAHDLGVEIGVVLGGGNILRGRSRENDRFLDHASADYIGMLATIMNGVLLGDVLEGYGLTPRLMSAIEAKNIAEPYFHKRARRHLEKGRIVIQVGGSGRPNFTTDSTAMLLAVDIKADAILKGTKVDGIYDSDPVLHKDAHFFPEIDYRDVKNKELEIVEEVMLSLNRFKKPAHVFNIFTQGNLKRLLLGEKIGSRIIF